MTLKPKNDMRNYSEAERKDLLKQVGADLRTLEKKYGEERVRWAINKLTAQRRERRQLEEQRQEAQAKLDELDKKAAAVRA